MSIEVILTIGSFLLSIMVAVFGFRKTRAETSNIDAQTFATYQEALRESHENYQAVICELQEVRAEIKAVKMQNERLECYNRALINQLVGADMIPVTMDEAIKRNCK